MPSSKIFYWVEIIIIINCPVNHENLKSHGDIEYSCGSKNDNVGLRNTGEDG